MEAEAPELDFLDFDLFAIVVQVLIEWLPTAEIVVDQIQLA